MAYWRTAAPSAALFRAFLTFLFQQIPDFLQQHRLVAFRRGRRLLGLCFLGRLFLGGQLGHEPDHQEQADCDDEKVDDILDKRAVGDDRIPDLIPIFVVIQCAYKFKKLFRGINMYTVKFGFFFYWYPCRNNKKRACMYSHVKVYFLTAYKYK